MEPIKNITNYDPVRLDAEYANAESRCKADPRQKTVERLRRRERRNIPTILFVIASVFVFGSLYLYNTDRISRAFYVPWSTAGIILFVVAFLSVLRSGFSSGDVVLLDAMREEYFSAALQYHDWVNGETVFAHYGAPTGDGTKFKVPVVISAEKYSDEPGTMKETFDFDAAKTEGDLALDVGSGVVFRS